MNTLNAPGGPSSIPLDRLGWPTRLRDELHRERTKESTAIAWTWHVRRDGDYNRGFTFNAWLGCTKVSAECALCYANTIATTKMGKNLWGRNARRMFTGDAYWKRLDKLERLASDLGHPIKIFVNSMSDLFEILCDGHPDIAAMDQARNRMFQEIENRPGLIFILCTKRPQNVLKLVPPSWQRRFPDNVWVLATAGTQQNVNAFVPILLTIPAAVRGLSVEPILGPVTLPQAFLGLKSRGWVICGGESGRKDEPVRPSHPDWAMNLRDQCDQAGVPFFYKQVGDWLHGSMIPVGSRSDRRATKLDATDRNQVHRWPDGTRSYRLSKRTAGRELGGREWNQFPTAI
jgi:protein gp37